MLAIPIFLINLDRDSDRRDHVLNQLQKTDLDKNITYIGAVEGSKLSQHDISAIYDEDKNKRHYAKPLTKGEMGCYASHIQCWTRIAELKIETALIIEDDITISPETKDMLTRIISLNIEFDMIKLIGRKRESTLKTLIKDKKFSLIEYFKAPNYTGAYIISAAGAKKLLEKRKPFFRPVDVDLRYWWEVDPNFKIFGIQPYPIHSTGFCSTIGERSPFSKLSIKFRFHKLKLQTIYQLHLLYFTAKKLFNNKWTTN